MCGIAGIMATSPEAGASLHAVLRMARAMRHRGPDDEGFLLGDRQGSVQGFLGTDSPAEVRRRWGSSMRDADGSDAMGRVALGHRRLSIVDLSSEGHQPMADSEGRRWIVFNGEIYDFRQLRRELESLGYAFRSDTDTEVILAAYARWGCACLARLHGDFAFAIWDREDGSLFCARDRIGIKPFHYVHLPGHFIFASDIKALLASGLHAPRPDPEGLYLSMMYGMAPRPLTAFEGIRALEQSCWMRVLADGRIERGRYWRIPIGTQDARMSLSDATAALEDGLERAVRRRLEADVQVGTFMSGGIDSTTVTAIAAASRPGIHAFTLGYRDCPPELDEVGQAADTARMCPVTHVIEMVDPVEVLGDLLAWIDGYEEPYYSLAANHVVSRVVRRHGVKVALNGLGGDELFGGYDMYRLPGWLGRICPSPMAFLADSFTRLTGSNRVALAVASSPDRVHSIAFSKWPESDLRRVLDPRWHLPTSAADYIHHLYARDLYFQDNVEAFSYMDLMNYVGNHHVHRVDQFTMACSIEGRFPLLDHELVELAFQVPSRWKVSPTEQKLVLRRVALDWIAPSCLSMRKKGFSLPLGQWVRGPLAPLVARSLESLMRRDIVRPEAVKECMRSYREGRLPVQRIWHLVSLELWMERFIDRWRVDSADA